MDVASSSPSHANLHETPPPDPSSVPPPPVSHHRRHARYSPTSTTHPPPPPHVVINARRRRSPNSSRARSNMNPSHSPPAVASSSHPPHSHSPPPHGQDHDRMETDEDSDHSDSEVESEDQEMDGPPPGQGPPPTHEDEQVMMDTTPDIPVTTLEILPPPGEPTIATPADLPALSNASNGGERPPDWTATSPDSWPSTGPPPPAEIEVVANDAMLDSGILRQELDEARRRTEPRERERTREDRDEDGDDGSDSDESMDEADNPYWANFTPDTSVPDESELASIEQNEEVDATDHDHWESTAFETLDDPEYVPRSTGRLSWTVTDNHGTPDKPNRKQIMRSPSVCIGGLYWNIKYFPRGNDGTDYMSVYVECASKPYESIEDVSQEGDAPAEEKIPVEGSDLPQAQTEASSSNPGGSDSGPNQPQPSHSPIREAERSSPETTSSTSDAEPEAPWAAAAQVACVIYNPQEPRVYAYQQSSHQYYNGNPDWGWTRFHGPWSEIHTRRRNQRKPLLQNDTLSFTVYIRIFEDHTKSLWWHSSDSHPIWDSVALLGLRGLKCREAQSSAMVAAVSAWMHLAGVVREVINLDLPDQVSKAGQHLKPALKEFQEVMFKEGLDPSPSDVNLNTIVSVLGFFYGFEVDSKRDVVIIWENLRRILNLECNADPETAKRDLFEDVIMLKQPDPFKDTQPSEAYVMEIRRNIPPLAIDYEPSSVQEALDYASMHKGKGFKTWDNLNGQSDRQAPSVLQVELHRQNYDVDTRKWKKLTHEIALNETVQCNEYDFTLYGMIVHRGGLDYSEYYSVLRPHGPGTRWIKYAGDGTSRAVEVLTRKSAIEGHEGSKEADESAAVAYIAMYVRTDRLAQVLREDKKEFLQESRKRKLEQMPIIENLKDANNMPFTVGGRFWRTPTPVIDGRVYDTIRDTSHLSRYFYRTEYNQEDLDPRIPEESKLEESTDKGTDPDEMNSEDAKEQNQHPEPSDPASQLIKVYLKIFNHNSPSLSDVKVFPANGGMNVIQTLKEQLVAEKDEPWDFYLQQGLTVKSKNLTRRSASFFDISYGDTTWDGMVFIAQRHPTVEETKILEADGKCVTPIEYSQYLLGDYHPALYSPHLSNHYFTYPYLSVPLSYGRPHGHGIHIALSGSNYHGPFRCGRKAGPAGTMRFANGDTYNGDWAADEPDGKGTMTYAKTGNVYKGGWRKRRRFGKGVMDYAVADEEMMLCGVCYERDMDAVFCFCGHVVACEECARRVEFCPVCREVVKRVVVLKGPLGSSGNAGVGSWGGGAEGGGGMGIIP